MLLEEDDCPMWIPHGGATKEATTGFSYLASDITDFILLSHKNIRYANRPWKVCNVLVNRLGLLIRKISSILGGHMLWYWCFCLDACHLV